VVDGHPITTIRIVASDSTRVTDRVAVTFDGGSPGSGGLGLSPGSGLTPPLPPFSTDVSGRHAILNYPPHVAASQPFEPPIVQCARCRQWMAIPADFPQPALCLACESRQAASP